MSNIIILSKHFNLFFFPFTVSISLCLYISLSLSLSLFLTSLYPTACSSSCPWKNFRRLYPGCPNFNFICEQLTSIDLEWFAEQALVYKQGYIFEVTLDYDHENSLFTSLDIGAIPFLRECKLDDLTGEQKKDALNQGKRANHCATQLTSTHDTNHHRIDFSYNILYMLANQNFCIKKVHCILKFTTERLLADYLEFLQKGRQNSTSKLQSSLIKTLGNSVPGRQTNRQTDRLTDWHTYRQTDKQVDRRTYELKKKLTKEQTLRVILFFFSCEKQLYKRLCPSVSPSVRRSVTRFSKPRI